MRVDLTNGVKLAHVLGEEVLGVGEGGLRAIFRPVRVPFSIVVGLVVPVDEDGVVLAPVHFVHAGVFLGRDEGP